MFIEPSIVLSTLLIFTHSVLITLSEVGTVWISICSWGSKAQRGEETAQVAKLRSSRFSTQTQAFNHYSALLKCL